jgi:hypothetical protein
MRLSKTNLPDHYHIYPEPFSQNELEQTLIDNQ